MEPDDPINALRKKVTAAQEEFDMAVTFHEVWKPAAYDAALHGRMGASYATQAFLVMRTALRREMVLALTRLWDKNKQSVRMQSVAADLRKPEILHALATARARSPDVFDLMKADLTTRAAEAVRLVNKYTEGGARAAVLQELLAMRHERLAHRQLAPATPIGANATDAAIEEFYQDNAELIRILLSVVNAMA